MVLKAGGATVWYSLHMKVIATCDMNNISWNCTRDVAKIVLMVLIRNGKDCE